MAARIATNTWPATLARVVAVRSNDPVCLGQCLADARALLGRSRVLGPVGNHRNRELTVRYRAATRELDALADALDAIHYFAAEIEPELTSTKTIVCEDYWSLRLDELRNAALGVAAERMIESMPAPRLIVSVAPHGFRRVPLPLEVEELRVPSGVLFRECLARELRLRGLGE